MKAGMLHAARGVITWPKTFTGENAPIEILAFAALIVPRLLAGDDPTMAALRAQYERAVIRRVELTHAGFFVDYDVPDDVPGPRRLDFTRGDVKVPVIGRGVPAGCRLVVCGGRLATFEGIVPADGWFEQEEEA